MEKFIGGGVFLTELAFFQHDVGHREGFIKGAILVANKWWRVIAHMDNFIGDTRSKLRGNKFQQFLEPKEMLPACLGGEARLPLARKSLVSGAFLSFPCQLERKVGVDRHHINKHLRPLKKARDRGVQGDFIIQTPVVIFVIDRQALPARVILQLGRWRDFGV